VKLYDFSTDEQIFFKNSLFYGNILSEVEIAESKSYFIIIDHIDQIELERAYILAVLMNYYFKMALCHALILDLCC
jgi:hypothetical protein